MQFTTVIVALFAAAAIAAPAPGYGRRVHKSKAAPVNQCASGQEPSCCNSAHGEPALGLDCAVNVLGGTCDGGSVQCCDANGTGGLIGLNLCLPIAL